jgi:hypothetical protein
VGGARYRHDLTYWIAIVRMQMLAGGTFPDVQMAVIFEASRAELSRTRSVPMS